jgi:hypothetical protein
MIRPKYVVFIVMAMLMIFVLSNKNSEEELSNSSMDSTTITTIHRTGEDSGLIQKYQFIDTSTEKPISFHKAMTLLVDKDDSFRNQVSRTTH